MSKYSSRGTNPGEQGVVHLFLPLVVLGLFASFIVLLNLRITTNTSGDTKVKGILIARGGDDNTQENRGPASGNTTVISQEPMELKLDVKSVEVENKEKTEVKYKMESQIKTEMSGKSGQVQFRPTEGKIEVSSTRGNSTAPTNLGEADNIKIKVKEGQKENEIELKAEDGRFEFKAKGVAAQSNFPLTLNNATGELSVQTPQGTKIIRLLPNQVAEIALRAGVQNKIEAIEVSENEQEKDESGLVFKVQGTKSGKFLGLIPISAPVETQIGAQTGNIVSVNEPGWFKLISNFVR